MVVVALSSAGLKSALVPVIEADSMSAPGDGATTTTGIGRDWPGASVPSSQPTVVAVAIVTVHPCGAETNLVPVGSGTVTLAAAKGSLPVFVAVAMIVSGAPADTGFGGAETTTLPSAAASKAPTSHELP